MDARTFKDNIYHQFARVGKVLSSPKRIELLDLLSQGPKSVELLAAETKMSIANTSKHLQALLEARLVDCHRDKNYVIYQLGDQSVVELLMAIKATAEKQLAELTLLRNDEIVNPDHSVSLSIEEVTERLNSKEAVLIDVRPRAEYEAGHIEGAISMPIHELHQYLKELPHDHEIIAYCRGPYCVYAADAVRLLQMNGFQAFRLEAGLHEWKKAQDTPLH